MSTCTVNRFYDQSGKLIVRCTHPSHSCLRICRINFQCFCIIVISIDILKFVVGIGFIVTWGSLRIEAAVFWRIQVILIPSFCIIWIRCNIICYILVYSCFRSNAFINSILLVKQACFHRNTVSVSSNTHKLSVKKVSTVIQPPVIIKIIVGIWIVCIKRFSPLPLCECIAGISDFIPLFKIKAACIYDLRVCTEDSDSYSTVWGVIGNCGRRIIILNIKFLRNHSIRADIFCIHHVSNRIFGICIIDRIPRIKSKVVIVCQSISIIFIFLYWLSSINICSHTVFISNGKRNTNRMVKQTIDFVFISTLWNCHRIWISRRIRGIVSFNIDVHNIAGIEVGCGKQSEASAADKVLIFILRNSIVIPICDTILNIACAYLQPLYTRGKVKAFVVITSVIFRVVISAYCQNIGSKFFCYRAFVFFTRQISPVITFVLVHSFIVKRKSVFSAKFVRKFTACIFLHVLVPSYAKIVVCSQLKFRGNVTHGIVNCCIVRGCITLNTIWTKYRIVVVKKNGRYRSNGVKILL